MIKQLLFFKFKSTYNDTDISKCFEAYRNLVGKTTLLKVEAGHNISLEGFDKGFTHAAIASFKDKAAVDEFLEAPEHNYILAPDNPKMAQFINYVKGFEIDIRHWEGKFKLSQDKKPQDIENARNELVRANQESIKAFLDQVF